MIDEARLVFVPFAEATTPPMGLINHIKNQWWVCHPDKGVVYWDSKPGRKKTDTKWLSPQCNLDETIARRFLSAFPAWAEVRLIPSVFHRIDPKDYA